MSCLDLTHTQLKRYPTNGFPKQNHKIQQITELPKKSNKNPETKTDPTQKLNRTGKEALSNETG